MNQEPIIYVSIALFLFMVGAGVFFYGMWKRKRNEILAVDHIIGEFWPQGGGERYRVLLKVEDNGKEVKAPKTATHQIPCYFFDRSSTSPAKYPSAPPLNIPLLGFTQVTIPMVSWLENDPEPINPYNHNEVATADMIGIAQDEEFGGLLVAASKEIQRLQEELIKALVAKLNKYIVYVALGLILVGVVAITYYLYGGLA